MSPNDSKALETFSSGRRFARECAKAGIVPEPVSWDMVFTLRSTNVTGARVVGSWSYEANGPLPCGCSTTVLETSLHWRWGGGMFEQRVCSYRQLARCLIHLARVAHRLRSLPHLDYVDISHNRLSDESVWLAVKALSMRAGEVNQKSALRWRK